MTTGPSPSAISVRGLRKSFGDEVVLDGIDLDAAAGPGSAPRSSRRARRWGS